MPIYLGIDGGGTKTLAAIAAEDRVLGMATGGGSNLVRAPLEQVRTSLHDAIRGACCNAGISPAQIEFACVGASGSSRPEIKAQVERIVREIVPARVEIMGDMDIAHAATFCDSPGIVVISGTGSIAYGRNAVGATARAGGWGRVTSDEGSGYWIGRRAVAAALRAEDAGQGSQLMTRIMQCWGVTTRQDVGLTANRTPVPDFSVLFPEVLAAASDGDALAGGILVEAGAELAQLAGTIVRRLWPAGESVEVAMAGGVFVQSSIVRQSFEDAVRAESIEVNVRLSTIEPVHGAIYLARKLAATAVSGGMQEENEQ